MPMEQVMLTDVVSNRANDSHLSRNAKHDVVQVGVYNTEVPLYVS